MRFRILSLLVVLSACASPSFLGEPSATVDVAGSTFRVYMQSGTGMVEAHRISFEALPSRSLTLNRAARAVEIATGCGIRNGTLTGDQAIVTAEVDCILP